MFRSPTQFSVVMIGEDSSFEALRAALLNAGFVMLEGAAQTLSDDELHEMGIERVVETTH
ncbi:hypothetical protein J2D73_18565 [Acetobacter sacchari]|uniref:Uncharacterized protein n=1 Tax=Acetobacter sacchari TaxID=2661687 RepID=A0ABS3M0X8_9PROT|nr:hypothetical protein [Acetobacter sacchari]MBO1361789.1 hypothetical protein [Acetobacter sacchari]